MLKGTIDIIDFWKKPIEVKNLRGNIDTEILLANIPQRNAKHERIVVHELCHFHHLDHTDAFWNEVDKVMPSYGERKEWLRVHGAGLDV